GNDDLEIAVRLPGQRAQRRFERVIAVVRRHDDRNQLRASRERVSAPRAEAKVLTQPIAPSPLAVAPHAEWQSQIVFARDLPPAEPDPRSLRSWHVPALQA